MRREKSGKKAGMITLFSLLLAGCTPTVPPPQLPEQNATREPLWQDTSTLESNYHLKPEPYSLDSNQKDPELLGPQSTLKEPLDRAAELYAGEGESGFLAKGDSASQASSPNGMSRSRCISLIGKSKFDQYTRQFGSETAAIRKCIILEKVQSP